MSSVLVKRRNFTVYYRISSGGYAKEKPDYVTKENCLVNFLEVFFHFQQRRPEFNCKLVVIADNCTKALQDNVVESVSRVWHDLPNTICVTDYKHGAGSFRFALKHALDSCRQPPASSDVIAPSPEDLYYFVEDDYIHMMHALDVLVDGLQFAAFVTGYDHPDKYRNSVLNFGKQTNFEDINTRVYCGTMGHYRSTSSTTMTFMTTAFNLQKFEPVFDAYTRGTHPQDFYMFLHLRCVYDAYVCSAIPGVCTHGETLFLGPFVDWKDIMVKSLQSYSQRNSVHPLPPLQTIPTTLTSID